MMSSSLSFFFSYQYVFCQHMQGQLNKGTIGAPAPGPEIKIGTSALCYHRKTQKQNLQGPIALDSKVIGSLIQGIRQQ